MKQQCVDLHTHTSASDGSDSPAEVVRKAAEQSLAALAVTDHDTLAGLAEAEGEASRHDLEFVRGCEISTQTEYGEVHLLGLWLPHSEQLLAPLEQVLSRARNARHIRNRLIVEKLVALGIPVSYEQVCEIAGGNVVGRPHFAEMLQRVGAVQSTKEAFDRYLKSGAAAYVPRQLPTPEEGVASLAATGALVSFAHPCLCRMPKEALESLVESLVPLGLGAVEAYHSEHSAQDERYCVGLASRFQLLLTGGSDYHGAVKPGIQLGSGKGRLHVTRALFDLLKPR
jgi:predicted metal-dependent phosphoesterase TrpH